MAQPNHLNQSEWQTGLFECLLDPANALDVYFCPCFAIARQWKAAYDSQPNVLDPILCCAACCCGTAMTPIVRFRVVDKYNIREHWFVTALVSLWFGPLSTCQTHRELTLQGLWPGGLIGSTPVEYKKMQ